LIEKPLGIQREFLRLPSETFLLILAVSQEILIRLRLSI
jgi:hypothetical protein